MMDDDERARRILDDPHNFVKDRVAGPIPMHFNALYGILAQAFAQVRRETQEQDAAQLAALRAALEGTQEVIKIAINSFPENSACRKELERALEWHKKALSATPPDAVKEEVTPHRRQ